jgi:hypothetical protein
MAFFSLPFCFLYGILLIVILFALGIMLIVLLPIGIMLYGILRNVIS